MLSTILFMLFCAAGMAMVWMRRSGYEFAGIFWMLALPPLVLALLTIGNNEGFGRQLRIAISELRIPLADATSDGTYFIIGPEAAESDLVVGPYGDELRSRDVSRPEFARLAWIERRDYNWRFCGRNVAPLSQSALPGMAVVLDGERVTQTECRVIVDTPLTVLIERRDTEEASAKRRHLYVSRSGEAIIIGLKSDEYLERDLGRCASTNRDMARLLRLAPAGWNARDLGYRVPDNLVFRQLGQGGTNALLDPMLLGPLADQSQLCRDGGTQDLQWPLQSTGALARLLGTAEVTSIGWWIVGLVFLTTAWTTWCCGLAWRGQKARAEGAVVALLQWLLSLRLMIAAAGLTNNSDLSQGSVMWPPAVSLLCVPLIAIALLRRQDDRVPGEMARLALLVPVAGLGLWWVMDWQAPGNQELVIIAGTLVLLGARAVSRHEAALLVRMVLLAIAIGRWGGKAFRNGAAWLRHKLPEWLTGWVVPMIGILRGATAEGPGHKLFQSGLALALALFVARATLALLGKPFDPDRFQERLNGVPVIENFPLSLVYAPLSIIAIALLVAGYRKSPGLGRAVWIGVAFVALFPFIAFVVSDLGLVFIFAWPAAWVIAGAIGEPSPTYKWLTRAVLIGPLLSPIMITGAYFMVNRTDVPAPAADISGHIDSSSAWTGNMVRLQRYVDTDTLVGIGNAEAFKSLETAAQVEPLTANLVGQGFMVPSGVGVPVRNYQYSDNLPAVHIAWPFGRIGLAALVLAIMAMVGGLLGRPGADRWFDIAARLAGLTIIWSAAYMALANCNLVPFTGRNIYLLAAASMGDLAEGLALVLLLALPFVWPHAEKRDE